jgi:hypothetical protein
LRRERRKPQRPLRRVRVWHLLGAPPLLLLLLLLLLVLPLLLPLLLLMLLLFLLWLLLLLLLPPPPLPWTRRAHADASASPLASRRNRPCLHTDQLLLPPSENVPWTRAGQRRFWSIGRDHFQRH